jgi:SAM-dependent methyltransferase
MVPTGNTETISCIFCGESSEPDPIVITENGWNGRQCPKCRLIYISPRPSQKAIQDLYAHDKAETNASVLLSDEFNRRLAARHAIKILRKYARSGRLLEIGSGPGFFVDEAREAGYSPFAIELNSIQATYVAEKGIPVERVPLADAYPARKFDVIYHCDVTSHFRDLIAEFKIMSDRLEPGGILMFETGNFADIAPSMYRHVGSFQYPDHLFLLSSANLDSLIHQIGLETIATYRYGRLIDLLLKAKKKPASQTTPPNPMPSPPKPRWKKKARQYVRHYLTYKVGRLYPLSFAPQTVIVVARKPSS